MIKLYGIKTAYLSEKKELLQKLPPSFYRPWLERHKSQRNDKTARASLAGLLLLQHVGKTDPLHYTKPGRPYLETPGLDFNITHTHDYVFCAIEERAPEEPSARPLDSAEGLSPFANQPRVGLDADELRRIAGVRIFPLASRWFSPEEYEFFLQEPNDASFLRIWTRKEALIKWTGDGMRALRNADTFLAKNLYGVRFYEYKIGDTQITLCCHSSSEPPPEICMLPDDTF